MPMTSRSLPGAAVRRTGDTMTGDLVLANNRALRGTEVGGTERDLASVDTANRVLVGNRGSPMRLSNNGTLDESDGATHSVRSNRNHAVVSKAADETLASDTTLQNDNELVLAVRASQTYLVRLRVAVTTAPTPDFKHAFSLPAAATIQMVGMTHHSGAMSTNNVGWNGSSQALLGSATTVFVEYLGLLTVDTTAGNLQYQWAQNTSDGASTIVEAGSSLEIVEIL